MKDGIYTEMSITEYHDNKTHLSSTTIRKARKSLKNMKHYMDTPQEKKSHFDFGNAFEIALIEGPETFHNKVVIFDPEYRAEPDKTMGSKLNREWKETIYDTDKYVVNSEGKESYESIEFMLEACKQDSVIQKLLNNTEYQVSLFWTDPVTGMKLKTRPDICKSKKSVIVDVKTSADGSPDAFGRDLAKFDYPLQACLQIKGAVESGLMEKVDKYYWLVVEKEPPYHATIYTFQKEDIEYYMDELEYLLNIVHSAQKENFYPGYTQRADNEYGILNANIPLWYKSIML